MSNTVRWEGVEEFSRWLRETPGVVERDVRAGLYLEGNNIMGTSIKNTPVDTGNLRASAHVTLPRTERGVTTVDLAYGTDYAIYVHERTGLNHPVGKAKFLEDAVKGEAKRFTQNLRRLIEQSMTRRAG